MDKINYAPRHDMYNTERYNSAVTKINVWEKRYKGEPEKVMFLVKDALKDTRSPGKRAAYENWLRDQADLKAERGLIDEYVSGLNQACDSVDMTIYVDNVEELKAYDLSLAGEYGITVSFDTEEEVRGAFNLMKKSKSILFNS